MLFISFLIHFLGTAVSVVIRKFEMCTRTFLSGSGIIPKVQKWENKNLKILLSGRDVYKMLKFRHKIRLATFLLIRQSGNILQLISRNGLAAVIFQSLRITYRRFTREHCGSTFRQCTPKLCCCGDDGFPSCGLIKCNRNVT